MFSAHTKPVRAVKFSSAGDVIASASEDGTISIRSNATGRLLRAPWKAHARAHALAFTPNGDKLASAGDTSVKLWDVVSMKEDPPLSHDSNVFDVAIDPKGGNLLAVASADGRLRSERFWKASSLTGWARPSQSISSTVGQPIIVH